MCYAPGRRSIAQASTHLDRPFHGPEIWCKMVGMESCKPNSSYALAARVACCLFRWVSGASAGLRGLVFYSASADGRVFHWTLGKSTMTCQVSACSSAWHSLDGTMLHAASDKAQHWLTQSSPECICSKSSSRTAFEGKLWIESVQYLIFQRFVWRPVSIATSLRCAGFLRAARHTGGGQSNQAASMGHCAPHDIAALWSHLHGLPPGTHLGCMLPAGAHQQAYPFEPMLCA